MSSESTPTSNAMNVETTQSHQQQQERPSQQQQQERPSQQRSAIESTAGKSSASTRLVDMESELREMELLITNDTPLHKMPVQFMNNYIAKKTQIDAKKEEIQKHVHYLIENKLLTKEDAQPFLKGIDSTDLESKRPVYGYLEASYEDRLRTVASSVAKMRELEENNKRALAEKDQMAGELESFKKKMKMADYSAPVTSKANLYEDGYGGGYGTMRDMAAPLQKETISLMRMNEKSPTEVIRRETVYDTNLASMFEPDLERITTIPSANRGHYAQLVSFMSKFST